MSVLAVSAQKIQHAGKGEKEKKNGALGDDKRGGGRDCANDVDVDAATAVLLPHDQLPPSRHPVVMILQGY